MGVKGVGKKGKADAQLAARAAKRAKKLAAKSASPDKREKVGKSKAPTATGPAGISSPVSTSITLTNNLQHGKWPSLFKKHISLLEAHVKTLDRLMQSMKSQMAEMDENERIQLESGEKGNWKVLCDMTNRSREVLANARASAKDILPAHTLKEKARLGVTSETVEPLGAKSAQRAAQDSDEDTEMSEASDFSDSSSSSSSLSSDDEEVAEQSFVPLMVDRKKRKSSGSAVGLENAEKSVDSNPYFVVDTDPTPVAVISSGAEKTRKKKKSMSKTGPKTTTPVLVETATVEQSVSNLEQAEVDFTAIQAQLQAEVEAGLKAQQEAESEEAASPSDSKKSKKKRKRHSEGLSSGGLIVEKKAKKEKSDQRDEKEKKKKRRASESAGELTIADGETKKKRKKQHVSAA